MTDRLAEILSHTNHFVFFFSEKLLWFFYHLQLIIITGPSYEALASEGIQLNMGGGNVEEVTCTVIGGVNYSQVCTADSKLRAAEDENSMTGALY